MRRASISILFVTVLLGFASAQNVTYQQDPNWKAPAAAAARANPLADKPEAVGGGKKLFERNCVECHGADGTGLIKKHAADLHLPTVQQQTDGVLFWKVTNGNPDRGMPSFSRLPDLQRWQLILCLRTLGESAPVDSQARSR